MKFSPFRCEHKFADLATPFGLEWATKLFGAEAIASLPVRTVGKNKGLPKGFVHWQKCTVPGYSRDHSTPFAVGQLVDAWIGAGPLSLRSGAVTGRWLGRNQALAATASAGYFFDEGRAKHAREEARYQADREAERAEWLAEREGR